MHPHLGRPSRGSVHGFGFDISLPGGVTDAVNSAKKAVQQAESDATSAAQQAGSVLSTVTGGGSGGGGVPVHGGNAPVQYAPATGPSLTTILLGGASLGALLFWWKRR